MYEAEQFFDCPHCGSPISVFVDPSVPTQTYVEDCEVCCRPIEISYHAEEGEITAFDAVAVEQ
ncbi:MAG TPA: CPXCG motif-containing cysteine-rich protein [Rhodothermales bacterium]|nr:CPXCG motif-containing cysteine-rich protein [Rhodothermales bacterium]